MFNPPEKDKALAAVAFNEGRFDADRPAYYLDADYIAAIQQKKQERLNYAMGANADAFLSDDIIDYDIPQRNAEEVFQSLIKLVRRGRITPFIGSGVSAQSGYKTWINCLRHFGRGTHIAAELNDLIDQKQFEQAASLLNENFSDSRFRAKIDTEFDKKRTPTPKGCVLNIPAIAAGTVITTNFDLVLRRAFEAAKKPFEREEFGVNCDHELIRGVLNGDRILLKLHGEIKSSATRIFTKAEYDAAYGEDGFELSKPLPKMLERIFRNQTLLFLGCSLESDRVLDLFKYLVAHDEDGERAFQRHYAILEAPKNIQEIYDREQFLSERQIFPLWFPHGDFDRFNAIIECLADEYYQ